MANRFANPESRAQVRMSKTISVSVDSPTQTIQDLIAIAIGLGLGGLLGPVAGARAALKQSQNKDYLASWANKLKAAIAAEEKATK